VNDDTPDDGDGIGDTGSGGAGAAGGTDRSGDGGPELRRLGVLGGMSPASTVEYYRGLNAGVNDALGGHHSAPVLVDSVDFAGIESRIAGDRWDEAGTLLAGRARALDRAGVAAVLLATNTMHRVAPAIEAALSVPLVHLHDVTAEAVLAADCGTVGLLGTRATMEGEFARDRLADHGLEVLVPGPDDRTLVDDAVFEELTHEVVREETREAFERVIDDLRDRGAEGVVLGCTELELLFDDAELWRDADGAGSVAAAERGDGRSGRGSAVPVPLFDTTALHVARGVEICLGRVDP